MNGADLGVYAHVEAIDNDFLERHFAKKSGALYEGTLSDFTPTYVGTFDSKNGADRSDLARVTTALMASDAELETKLSAVVDLDQPFVIEHRALDERRGLEVTFAETQGATRSASMIVVR